MKNITFYIHCVKQSHCVVIAQHDDGSDEASPWMTYKKCEEYIENIKSNQSNKQIFNVNNNGRFFICWRCHNPISETIMSNIHYCHDCGAKLTWNVWDKEKNELKPGVKI